MSPTCRCAGFLSNSLRMIPTTANTAVMVPVDRMLPIAEPPSRYPRQMIQPVMLVPRMEPRITPMPCRTFIIPALTKPTVMTEVAQDDCSTAVTPVPRRMPRSGVPDSRYRIGSSFAPEAFFSPSPICVMPKRNKAMPHSNSNTCDVSIQRAPSETEWCIQTVLFQLIHLRSERIAAIISQNTLSGNLFL